MVNSVVLTPKNDSINEINNILIQRFPAKTTDPNNQGQYEDFINSLEPNGLSPHKLYLKKKTVPLWS